ncbi:MAG: hypothetical protein KIT80_17550 [Chitinophagaceae bacterium]|nr:hypothetical protein [Chitinophagaceae bacterium]MCW5928729.1 hypothetical protein [Chitinophagaceae bacterium]
MELSKKNAIALLFDINQDIEEYAESTVKNIIDEKILTSFTHPIMG